VVRVGENDFTPSKEPINCQSRAWCQPGEHAVGGGGHVAALTEDRLGGYYSFLVHRDPVNASGEAPTTAGEATGWLVEVTNPAHGGATRPVSRRWTKFSPIGCIWRSLGCSGQVRSPRQGVSRWG
jgi:hypothetical protein